MLHTDISSFKHQSLLCANGLNVHVSCIRILFVILLHFSFSPLFMFSTKLMLSPRSPLSILKGLRQVICPVQFNPTAQVPHYHHIYRSFSTTAQIIAQEYRLKGLTSLDLKPGEKKEVEVEGIEGGKVLLCNVGGKVTAVESKCRYRTNTSIYRFLTLPRYTLRRTTGKGCLDLRWTKLACCNSRAV